MDDTSFIATGELGKLAKWIRVLGYDCVYHGRGKESDLIMRALRDRRVLLTRTGRLTRYRGLRVIVVRKDNVEDRIEQVVEELGLPVDAEELFRRCVKCNSVLSDVKKRDLKGKVPEYVFDTQNEFRQCPQCGKIFWKGTHWDNVERKFKQLRAKVARATGGQ